MRQVYKIKNNHDIYWQKKKNRSKAILLIILEKMWKLVPMSKHCQTCESHKYTKSYYKQNFQKSYISQQ